MRSTRLRQIIALSAMVALVGCSSGGTGGTSGGSTRSVQRSSRILKKKKPAPGATSSAATQKPTVTAPAQ